MAVNSISQNSTLPNVQDDKMSRVNPIWIAALFFIGAMLVRLIRIDSVPFGGDEPGSLIEAQKLSNLHAASYFLLLRAWMQFGESALWLRLLSISLGSLAVSMCWLWLKRLRGDSVAALAALLLLLSPFAVEYSQEIRFYALYLFASILFLWVYTTCVMRGKPVNTRRRLVLVVVSGILLATSHLIGLLLVSLAAVHWIIYVHRPASQLHRVAIRIVFMLILAAVIAVALFPAVRELGYQATRLLNGSGASEYGGGRGFSYTSFAKLALNFLTFSLGQYLYPFNLRVVIPSLLLVGIIAISGLVSLSRCANRQFLGIAYLLGIGPLLTLYLVLDPLWPANSPDSATSKYVLGALPVFLWILAEGAVGLPKKRGRLIGIATLLIIQLIGLRYLYVAEWHVGHKATNYTLAARAISEINSGGQGTVIADGRSQGILHFYLGESTELVSAYETASSISEETPLLLPEGLIFIVSNDYRESSRCYLEPLMQEMVDKQEVYALADFPLFVYAYDDASQVNSNLEYHEISIPHSLYGMEFADLELPANVDWSGTVLSVTGMYSLPNCAGFRSLKTEELSKFEYQAESILLLSNMTGANELEDGSIIGTATVVGQDGTQTTFELRKGYETQTWDGHCTGGCSSVLRWHKRIALVGHSDSRYPETYRDFTAHVWGVELQLPRLMTIESVEINLRETSAQLNVWGLFAFNSE